MARNGKCCHSERSEEPRVVSLPTIKSSFLPDAISPPPDLPRGCGRRRGCPRVRSLPAYGEGWGADKGTSRCLNWEDAPAIFHAFSPSCPPSPSTERGSHACTGWAYPPLRQRREGAMRVRGEHTLPLRQRRGGTMVFQLYYLQKTPTIARSCLTPSDALHFRRVLVQNSGFACRGRADRLLKSLETALPPASR